MPPLWYRLLIVLLVPLYRLRLWMRSRHEPDYLSELSERFGPFAPSHIALSHSALSHSAPTDSQRPVWVHAVSVGETNAAQPVIQWLLDQGYPVLVTNTTRTGKARVRQLFGKYPPSQLESLFLPVDREAVLRPFIEQFQPRLVLLMETELWPTLLALLNQQGIPAMLLNARLSEKSAAGYARFPSLTRPMLAALNRIAAQDEETARRLIALGARPDTVIVTGSLKFDLQPPPDLPEQVIQLRQQWALSGRRVLVAGSTHEPEENQLLNIFKALHERFPDVVLVLVPRHPERFGTVAALITEKGWPLARRSAGDSIAQETAVYLADTMGELWLWYALSQMAFVGGSLAPTGGHNPLEPARLGVPVVMGPNTQNFASIVAALEASGGLVQVTEVSGVYAQWAAWLQDESQRVSAGKAGQHFMQANQGALQRQLALVEHGLNLVDGSP